MSIRDTDIWDDMVYFGEQMDPETLALWADIGDRLLKGQKHYGGFKFDEYDLDQMALEEIEDFIVYRAAKKYLKSR